MEDKLKVKELAAQLGIGNKDLLSLLRELDIPVKSLMSSLDDDQVAQVRAHVSQGQVSSQVVRKEVQPGVIVRRRKRKRAASAPEPEPEAQEIAEDTVEAVEAAAEVSPQKPVPEVEAPVQARIVEPAAPEAPEAVEVALEADASEPQPEAAPEVEAPAEAPEPQATPEAEAPSAVEVAPEADVSEPQPEPAPEQEAAPKAEPETATEEAEDVGEAKDKKKSKTAQGEKFDGAQVRIISKPKTPERPARPARPAQPARGRPGGDRPSRPGRPSPGGYAGPGGPGAPVPPRPDDSPGRGRKRKKDRRVVDFGGGAGGDRSPGAKRRMDGNFGDRPTRGKPKRGRKGGRQEAEQPSATAPMKAAKRKIRIDEAIRVADLAHQIGIKSPEIIRVLMGLGVMATINQSLDVDTATVVAGEFGYEIEKVGFAEADYLPTAEPDTEEQLKPRPPVVTIMGHVDHGKTSLLDAIRISKVAAGEAGGITQHIGAYHVPTERGEVVFLDTPGHEAFTAMRARGAQVTDLVILVVAADDGVMDQTREAVSHSKAAGVPIVVAVNKMDKEGANPDRVKRELADIGLASEDWGGDTIFVPVSAKQKTGLDDLLEMVLLQAEVLELKANPDKPARGHIVEAKLDKGRGPVGTVLIQEGTLKQGDSFVCGLHYGKVRAMFDDQGQKIEEAGPAMPVEVQGFDGVPDAGDEFVAVTDDKVARRIADQRQMKQRERELAKESKVTLESFLKSRGEAEVKHLPVIIKADVQGSLEAIAESLRKLATDEVKIDIIHSGAGAITESDILLASASGAIIIGFNIRATAKIREVAEREGVEIRYYDIIYKLVEEVKDAMAGMLAPVITEEYLGQAEVRDTFSVPKVGMVAGCMVVDGKLMRNANVRLLREGVVIYTGKLSSLRRFKDDVKEVAKGYECGVGLENFNDIKVGDVIEAFEEKETKATLD